MYSTFLDRRHNSHWTHSPQTWLQNIMAVFWRYCQDSEQDTDIQGFNLIQFFFCKVFQITSRFVLAKKHFGTLQQVHFKTTANCSLTQKSDGRQSSACLMISICPCFVITFLQINSMKHSHEFAVTVSLTIQLVQSFSR